jgi:DNA-binding NarL/FixJ family response regulator
LFRKKEYDLILLDLKLPGLSGEEVLSTIRKENPFITVIVYTNYSDFADIKRLTNIGIDGYINKGPEADLGELIEAIEKKLAPMDDQTIDLLFKEFPTD